MFIPLLLLLFMFKYKWNQTMIIMSLMIVPSTILLYSNSMPVSLSSMTTLDYMSSMLMVLTIWIMPMVIAASQKIYMNHSSPMFLCYIITLTIILLMAFSSSHLFSFYILFEASLIPTLLIIMKWGYQPERLQAGMYLMLYTITASLPLLAGISIQAQLFNLNHIFFPLFSFSMFYSSFWLMMNLAFMVKLPLFAFHLWLPKAHVEAPVAGSMILAAVLLKLGAYGMLRMMYLIPPIYPMLKFYLMSLALWGGMITSMICVRQQDMKSLIAYSSVGHMSLVMAGVLSNISWGIWGAMSMVISHGLLSSAMFASTDMCYSMSNSRSLLMNKGLNISIPTMSMLWFIMCAANMAAPPSSNLLSEIMLITSSTITSKLMLIPLAVMSFVAAVYSLTLYVNINHGAISNLNTPASFLIPRNLMVIMGHVTPVFLIILMPSLITIF
uniref:NADH-ubiquinone oxidoreductase chain 4 n=1 Tax=Platynereis bicanaliculata TaxID=868042 RepID=A0A7G8JTM6_9ANNE|nr:NADH dehydrogenase subunit 4 [Platynereis bicanaliculata]QNJ33924.1 NADH dehydrogenase subunit 4 [Platynereis bicanaliculata]